MTDLRTAAQRLLGAVCAALPYAPYRAEFDVVADTADALRAALAQQPEPAQEPVAWEDWWRSHGQYNFRATARMTFERAKELMKLAFEVGREAAPQPQQPEPAQEPVAWRWGYRSVTTGEMDWRGYVEIAAHPNLRSPEIIMEPLYTAPPQRKPLTEEEIADAANSVRWSQQYHVDFARAIERAHGIGDSDE